MCCWHQHIGRQVPSLCLTLPAIQGDYFGNTCGCGKREQKAQWKLYNILYENKPQSLCFQFRATQFHIPKYLSNILGIYDHMFIKTFQ